MKYICVFCASSMGAQPAYKQAAQQLGELLAKRQLSLVYGGAKVGLMGAIADATLAAGGEVIGVIPDFMVAKEIAHDGITQLHIVNSMHERKTMMSQIADAFVALPGGMGTLEEFSEILTWAQLGLHKKPCGVLNINGYYDSLLAFFDKAVTEELLRSVHRSLVLEASDPEKLLDLLANYQPQNVDKWIEKNVKP
ncbi:MULTISPECIES: LOG family protein [Nostocales]|uniref:Cytokinin riboside 5'-monophosphate phosphoribohydrolase n=3 Tax=Nostocales TaxID=1161 RepID=A0A0C1NEQ7_9CYAN|nr:TIGR00730 family Rossman fold protein [Tolypothrix bouteillei]KAF3887342.1 TIGR00730 family Rossman fold protein [Tolypothrix bouteillei VB521301]